MSGRVLVCLTCDRSATPGGDAPSRGRVLARALLAHGAARDVTVRTVECLNGCPHPCTAALRATGKSAIRFSGLTPEDAPALIAAAETYAASADGELTDAALPPRLREKISLRVPSLRMP